MVNAPVFRFAPSPNGWLHLGHAYSALLNAKLADDFDGKLLLRIEDVDHRRCNPRYITELIEDLRWLGVRWSGAVWRQSQRRSVYAEALETLRDQGLVYQSFLTRKAIAEIAADANINGKLWPLDPNGVPLCPPSERDLSPSEIETRLKSHQSFCWRLNMTKAVASFGNVQTFAESNDSTMQSFHQVALKLHCWGDIVIARKDIPTSYHLAVVVDDAAQGVTHIVRGLDLFRSTAIHRLLQKILGLQEPVYLHHRLILNEHGDKLSKSNNDTALRTMRKAGLSPEAIRTLVCP